MGDSFLERSSASRLAGLSLMAVTLMALPLAVTRKVPVLGVVVASSRSKAMVMESPSISAVLTFNGRTLR